MMNYREEYSILLAVNGAYSGRVKFIEKALNHIYGFKDYFYLIGKSTDWIQRFEKEWLRSSVSPEEVFNQPVAEFLSMPERWKYNLTKLELIADNLAIWGEIFEDALNGFRHTLDEYIKCKLTNKPLPDYVLFNYLHENIYEIMVNVMMSIHDLSHIDAIIRDDNTEEDELLDYDLNNPNDSLVYMVRDMYSFALMGYHALGIDTWDGKITDEYREWLTQNLISK